MNRTTYLIVATALTIAACGGSDIGSNGDVVATDPPAAAAEESTDATEAAAQMSEDEVAITEAYGIAFNSESSFDQTSPYLITPQGLEETVAGYQDIGTQMGGVAVSIDSIEVDGDTAAITYTLLFGGNPTYSDLTGSATRTETGWQISREMFCGLMTSARVGCPDG